MAVGVDQALGAVDGSAAMDSDSGASETEKLAERNKRREERH